MKTISHRSLQEKFRSTISNWTIWDRRVKATFRQRTTTVCLLFNQYSQTVQARLTQNLLQPLSGESIEGLVKKLSLKENSFCREYFHARGNLVCDPNQDDESFSSQPDDFESSNEYQKLDTSSSASSQEMAKIMNQSNMSESLLYCLDGNDVTADVTATSSSQSPSPMKSRKRHHDDSMKDESSLEMLKRPLIESDLTDL